ncbi:MAG: tRNA (adenosine(37)-N6)-threonylcarbamoyltransferase complex transferase subunit TsaD [Peptococcaceae bacterium]|nr:tRNA (adenosine(37)-N6)-threonylcarbamoyltransferase complex transferase subunit TsaD [Peptococcaceae bacterium]
MSVVILAIETSCDDTSAAVVADGQRILSNVVSSQTDIHSKFGGVVPEEASRKHLELINLVVAEALAVAGMEFADLDAVAVTYGPGLVGALLIGVSAAKAIAFGLDIPLIGVNHIEGHIYANFLNEPDIAFPLISLVVSGGHSSLVSMDKHGSFRLTGATRDDAAGEAFDKIARALGLGYPGGPVIDRLAREGDESRIVFPKAYLEEGSFDFSFSGLKSAVMNYMRKAQRDNIEVDQADLAAGFQKAVVDVLVDKTLAAAKKENITTILLAGGVASNSKLREELIRRAADGCRVLIPPPALCTDNGAMVGAAAYYKYLRGDFAPLSLNASPGLKLGEQRYEGNYSGRIM